jgi:hypothetical protein
VAKVLDEENELLNQRSRAAGAAALEESGLLKVAEDHAVSTRDLTDAYLGNNDARIRLNKQIRDQIAGLQELQAEKRSRGEADDRDIGIEIAALKDLQVEIDGAIGGRQQESAAIDRQHKATEGSTSATKSATQAMEEQIAVLQELIDAQREAAGIVLSQRDAERQLIETFNAAQEAATKYAKQGLDINTEAGRANSEALDEIANNTFSLIDAQAKNGASNQQLAQTMEVSRQKFIATAIQMGATEAEAIALANQLRLIPTAVQTRVALDDEYARRRAAEFDALIRNIPPEKIVNLRVSTQGNGHHLAGLATGGPALPGRSYLVGERGPEILQMPNMIGGRIFSNAQSADMAGGGSTTIFVTIDGKQLQGRIDRTVRENNSSMKRAASSGAGGAR